MSGTYQNIHRLNSSVFIVYIKQCFNYSTAQELISSYSLSKSKRATNDLDVINYFVIVTKTKLWGVFSILIFPPYLHYTLVYTNKQEINNLLWFFSVLVTNLRTS